MKIKIDLNGILHIERAGNMKKAFCPYDTDPCACGDWCPLFGEPMYFQDTGYLMLCNNNKIIFKDCEDNRNNQ
jgi:hypothetical protein